MRWLPLLLIFALGCQPTEEAKATDPAVKPAQETPATAQAKLIKTEDGKNLEALYYAPKEDSKTAVLLLHQFRQDAHQWADWPGRLSESHHVLAISLRGHGRSAPYGKALRQLLTDPAGAPKDVKASIDWLKEQGAEKVAVVGTSIGANLSLVASAKGWASAAVAVSARRPPTESLNGGPVDGKLKNVFFLAAEGDQGGQADDSRDMHGKTEGQKNIMIADGEAHGIGLLREQPELYESIEDFVAIALGK